MTENENLATCAPAATREQVENPEANIPEVKNEVNDNVEAEAPAVKKELAENAEANVGVVRKEPDSVDDAAPGTEDDSQRSAKKMKLESSGDPDQNWKIVKQLEYYFSDVNVIKDRFLLEQIKKGDGWVKLSTLLTFSKLKDMITDEDRLTEIIQSCKSEHLVLDATKKVIKRKEPLPDFDEYKKQVDLRTVHISGFPSDYKFESLRQFCLRYGVVESLSMRRHFKTKFFKGCIHVVFQREEDAKKVLELDILKCKDRELKKESMQEYHRRKEEMKQKRAEKKKQDKE